MGMKKIGDWDKVNRLIKNLPQHMEVLANLNLVLNKYKRSLGDKYSDISIELEYDEKLKSTSEAVKGHQVVIGRCTPTEREEIITILKSNYPNIKFGNNN